MPNDGEYAETGEPISRLKPNCNGQGSAFGPLRLQLMALFSGAVRIVRDVSGYRFSNG